MKKDTSWGNVASWYFEHLATPDSYHAQVILPNLTRVMDVQKNERVLDLACGTGFFSEIFYSLGAQVLGVDISPELIKIAKSHVQSVQGIQNGNKNDISFFVAPAHDLSSIKSIENKSIDKIALVLAIQNIQEIKEMFLECRRVLRDGGKMFIVMNHPAFRIPGASSWGFDEAAKRQYRRIDQYLSEKSMEISMHPGSDPSEKTISFHRPLQVYFKALASASFAVTRLEEWNSHRVSEAGPRQKEEDRMRKEIPLFMLLELYMQPSGV